MPRRGTEVAQLPMPPKKKNKVIEEPEPSLDVSFCDDEALPPGIVFADVQQKNWRIGKPIGRGSFGRIYLASDDTEKEVTKFNARYVVKIEPHTNGPLFVEIHCLIRSAQAAKVKSWRQQNKQKRLGMPIYIASGSFTDENSGVKYRFLVLPRYDIDLQKIIARTKVLDLRNVLVLAIQILDVLEYLHSQGYTHSDIKSSNLMLGFDGIKLGKLPLVKLPPSFQKETKEVTVLSGKQRRVKSGKNRTSNYYDDEDFVVKDYKSPSPPEVSENDKRLANVKKKLRKILSDKDSRTLHRHHAFNLRQLSSYVNYEDLNSSVCSDQSYQKLIDDFGNNLIRSTEKFCDQSRKEEMVETDSHLNEIYKEAILSQSNGQIFLLDYGLASKFLDADGKHKAFGMDARKAHDGTLEYSSRDSHIGAHSRRSDLETLGYNLLDWLTGTLPWKTAEVLAEPDLVHALKKNFMGDLKLLLKTCFKTEFYPQFLEKYLQYVTSLEFAEKPDYEYCKSLFMSELLKNGYDKDMSLNFAEASQTSINRNKLCYSKRFGNKNTPRDFIARNGIKKTYERENMYSLENNLKLELLKETLNSSSDGIRKPCTSRNFFISDADLIARLKKSLMPFDIFGKKLSPKNLRSKKKTIQKRRGLKKHRSSIGKFGNFMGSARQFTWAEILAGNPEHIIRKERNTTTSDDNDDDEATCKYRIRKMSSSLSENNDQIQSPLLQKDYLQGLNPTYAMKDVVACLKKRTSGKPAKEPEEDIHGLQGYTPAMIKVYRMKEKREAKERLDALKQQSSAKKEVVHVQPRSTRSSKKVVPETVSVPVARATRKKLSSESSHEKSVEKVEIKSKEKPTETVSVSVSRATRKKLSSESSREKSVEKVEIKSKEKPTETVSVSVSRATRKKLSSESSHEKSVEKVEIKSKEKPTETVSVPIARATRKKLFSESSHEKCVERVDIKSKEKPTETVSVPVARATRKKLYSESSHEKSNEKVEIRSKEKPSETGSVPVSRATRKKLSNESSHEKSIEMVEIKSKEKPTETVSVPIARATRKKLSSESSHEKSAEKLEIKSKEKSTQTVSVPVSRASRKKLSSESSHEKYNEKVEIKSKEKPTPKTTKGTRKKTIQVIEEVKTPVKRKARTRSTVTVPNNRRRLRSSCHKPN